MCGVLIAVPGWQEIYLETCIDCSFIVAHIEGPLDLGLALASFCMVLLGRGRPGAQGGLS